jgi:hypothetical protein
VEEFIFLFQCLEEKKRVIFVAQIAISGASRAREFISGQAKITPDGHDDAGKGPYLVKQPCCLATSKAHCRVFKRRGHH